MSIQEKQQYLRQQILDRDLDPQEFVKFINTHFGMDQTSVLNVTLQQLKMIVSQFVRETNGQQQKKGIQNQQVKKKESEEEDEFGEFGESEIEQKNENVGVPLVIDFDWSYLGTPKKEKEREEVKPVVMKQEEVKSKKQQPKKPVINAALLDLVMQSPPVKKPQSSTPSLLASDVYNQMFKSSEANLKLKCLKQPPNLLDALTNLTFSVKDHNIQDNTKTYINKLLGSKQVLYTILTEGRNKQNKITTWQVSRKYSDFQWLRLCLTRKNPGLIIPPLPKYPDVESPASIMNYFLQEVSKQGELKSSKYFEIFLSYNTYSEFEGYKKNNELVQKPESVGNIEHPLGEIECNFSEGLNPFSLLIVDYSAKTSLELKRIKDISKEINLLFYNINLKFNEISEVFDKIKGYTSEISNDSKNEFIPLRKLSKTYEYLTGLMTDHSTIMLKEKDRIDNFFKDYFSYEDSKLKEIKTLIDKRNEFSNLYAKRSAQEIKDVSPGVLSKFSSALFGQKQESVDSPSSNFKVFKNQYGYYNEQMVKESMMFCDREVVSYTEHFTRYANEQLGNLEEMQEYWSNVIVSLSRLNINALA